MRTGELNDTVEQWILRINRLREWMAELALPAFAAEDRVALRRAHLPWGRYLCADQDRAVLPVVNPGCRSSNKLDRRVCAGAHPLPRGRHAKVVYSADGPPTLAARIQDLYDIKDGIWIANRRVPVRIQCSRQVIGRCRSRKSCGLLAQTYPQLKQQLQRRYPKHEWR